MEKLLVGIDGSEQALKAVDFACNLVRRNAAQLLLVHVVREEEVATDTAWQQIRDIYHRMAADVLAQATARAARQGIADLHTEVRGGDPAEALLELAEQRQCDAIVLGSRGHGQLAGLLLGSVTYKVLSLAHCTVIVAR